VVALDKKGITLFQESVKEERTKWNRRAILRHSGRKFNTCNFQYILVKCYVYIYREREVDR
jgi:hypothetical protein